jgi:hypothetical protein
MSFNNRLGNTPQAYSVHVSFCENPRCRRPHVVLLDRNDKPIAHFVCPDPQPDGTGFFHDLKDALYRSAVERDKS